MKNTEFKKGEIIRTGFYTGTGKNTKSHNVTGQKMQELNNAGFYGIEKNDAPRNGVGGKYILVLGKYLKSKASIRKLAFQKINFLDFGDELYHGCGVYRVAVNHENKIIASLYGGYHDSCPMNVKPDAWEKVCKEVFASFGHVHKVDGSGTQFFFRENPGFEVKEYFVPNMNGFPHLNLQYIEK